MFRRFFTKEDKPAFWLGQHVYIGNYRNEQVYLGMGTVVRIMPDEQPPQYEIRLDDPTPAGEQVVICTRQEFYLA